MNAGAATQPPRGPEPRLAGLPIGFFGAVMGLEGLSAAWKLAQPLWGVPVWIAPSLGAMAVLAFVALGVAYAIKAVSAPQQVWAEWQNPISGPLFGTPLISALLLPMALAPIHLPLARGLWAVGAVGMTLLAWTMCVRWLRGGMTWSQVAPTWIVPVVGLLDIPLAMPALGWQDNAHGVMVWGLAIGLFMAVPLLTLLMARLMFEPPLPAALSPTLLILLAPFAVGGSAYMVTTGRVDVVAEALLALSVFWLVVLSVRLVHLPRCCPFRVGWWAVSFPLAATAGTALRWAAHSANPLAHALALGLLVLASVVIAFLLWRTVSAPMRR